MTRATLRSTTCASSATKRLNFAHAVEHVLGGHGGGAVAGPADGGGQPGAHALRHSHELQRTGQHWVSRERPTLIQGGEGSEI